MSAVRNLVEVALAETEVDGQLVHVEVLAAPNAIGVCKVRRGAREFMRYHSRVRPLNPQCAKLLAAGDRVVTRSASDAVKSKEPKVEGWTIPEVDLLRQYLANQVAELQLALSHSRSRTQHARDLSEWNLRMAQLRSVNGWLKAQRAKAYGPVAMPTRAALEALRDATAALAAACHADCRPGVLEHLRRFDEALANWPASSRGEESKP